MKTARIAPAAEPDLTSTEAYGDVFAAALKGTDPTEAGVLRRAVALRDAAEKLMVVQAQYMRAHRYGWEEIGHCLGMTRQGAQRFVQRHEGTR